MSKLYKRGITDRNGWRQVTSYHGSNCWQEIKYAANKEWGNPDELSPYVRYGNQRYWLDEFMCPGPAAQEDFKRELGQDVAGYLSLTIESGMVIVLSRDCDMAKVFYFWSTSGPVETKGEN